VCIFSHLPFAAGFPGRTTRRLPGPWAIRELLTQLNDRPFRKLPGSRRSLFGSLDRPAMRPLPAHRFVYAEWKKARVNIDYHVEVERHYYSVAYQLVGQQLDVRVSAQTVECMSPSATTRLHQRRRSAIATFGRSDTRSSRARTPRSVRARSSGSTGASCQRAGRAPRRQGRSALQVPSGTEARRPGRSGAGSISPWRVSAS
jgi:Mu transposase, C-terminal domain